MYLYYFNSNISGAPETTVIVVEIDRLEVVKRPFKNLTDYAKVLLKHKIKSRFWFKTGVNEGEIFERSFWLKDYDIKRADDIITNYEKTKWMEMREKLAKLDKQINTRKEFISHV